MNAHIEVVAQAIQRLDITGDWPWEKLSDESQALYRRMAHAAVCAIGDNVWSKYMDECLCWVGHGGCGGCSDYPGIRHEPACGWEWDPDCPVHIPGPPEQVGAWTR